MGGITIEDVYAEMKDLGKEIKSMRKELNDALLTPKEELLLEKALEEKKEGKTTSIEELEKELG